MHIRWMVLCPLFPSFLPFFLCSMHGICGQFVFETAEFHRTTRNRSRIKRWYCHKRVVEIYNAICVFWSEIFLAENFDYRVERYRGQLSLMIVYKIWHNNKRTWCRNLCKILIWIILIYFKSFVKETRILISTKKEITII